MYTNLHISCNMPSQCYMKRGPGRSTRASPNTTRNPKSFWRRRYGKFVLFICLIYDNQQTTVTHFGENKILHLESSKQNYCIISFWAIIKLETIFTHTSRHSAVHNTSTCPWIYGGDNASCSSSRMHFCLTPRKAHAQQHCWPGLL